MGRETATSCGVRSVNYPAKLIRPNRGFILPSPLMLVGGVALAFGITTLMFWRLYSGTLSEYQTFRAGVEQAQEQNEIEYRRKLDRMAEEYARTQESWQSALAVLAAKRSAAHIRVQPDSDKGRVSAVSITAGKSDAATPELLADPSISVAECEVRVNNAVQDAAQVVHLQDFIVKQREASK